ncbi:MAG: NlpC/P60 family protein [Salaquimonas sp.]
MNTDLTTEIILAECREWIGTPYRHQASKKQVGCDCLGLLRGVWRRLYGCEPQKLPAYSADWGEADSQEHLFAAAHEHMIPAQEFAIGRAILFRWQSNLPAKHIGILMSENTFVHAYERVGVIQSSLGNHWRPRIVGCFEFPVPAKDISA